MTDHISIWYELLGRSAHEKIVRSRHLAGQARILALRHHRRRWPHHLRRGHTGQVDDSGKSLAADFDAQFKQTFRNIEKTLAEAGAKLSDMVTMTVFLIDARYTTRMTELRGELFGQDFPASAAITVQGFAQPEMMIEVQGIAVTA